VKNLNKLLEPLVDPGVVPLLDRVPLAMRQELLADDQAFITRQQLTRTLVERFTAEMQSWSSPDVLRAVLPKTGLSRNRMQPLAGALGLISSERHLRYSYFAHAPLSYYLRPTTATTLIVAVHGSSRNAKAHRDSFSTFAEQHACFVLAPIFPIELNAAFPDEEYKYVAGGKTRYDRVLFDLIEEFSGIAQVQFSKILFYGFSGGAQFGHRLMYAHPEKFAAWSICAPGFITVPSEQHDWWVGVRNFEAVFGEAFRKEKMQGTQVQLLCGAEDCIPFEIYSRDEMGLSEAEYLDYGADRVSRIHRLHREYQKLGVDSQLKLVKNCGHGFMGLQADVEQFFLRHLEDTSLKQDAYGLT
jgi:pimeloyl-ACP methyl ester carboxylesterase